MKHQRSSNVAQPSSPLLSSLLLLVSLLLLLPLCSSSYIESSSTLNPSIISSSFQSNLHQWEPYVKTATQTALDYLSHKTPTIQWREDEKWKENILVGVSSLYTLSIEIDGKYGGLGFEFSFVDTNSTKFDNLWALPPPSLATPQKPHHSLPLLPHTNTLSPAPSHDSPLIPYIEETPVHSPGELTFTALQGPIQLHFPDPATDIRIKTPRDVEAGLVSSIMVERGATVFLAGATSAELREPVEIDNTLTRNQQSYTTLHLKQTPKLNIYGSKVTISNGTSEGQLKTKKKGNYGSLEITNSSSIVQTDRISLFMSDSNTQQVNHALAQVASNLGSSEIPKVRRILGGKIQPVLSFLIPIDVSFDGDDNNAKSERSGFETYQAFVVQEYSSMPRKESQKVVSLWQSNVQNSVSFEASLLTNTTMENLGDFAKHSKLIV
eukprot:TRINITY_DN6058_c0_g5_i1.p1 TRINITY_DN6058_c0_g5~~TRINITY_DN6058_c0_g5_i1.p1  ORF type:complete len:437 (+),score=111.61 TRINITY_DN6058_c0_g5_i1:128-1438(+)